ncbi:MAG: hypothetical protein ACK5MV_05415 [Aminipila sp.]
MGIIKQTITCICIGIIFVSCQACENQLIHTLTARAEAEILKDYSARDIKDHCLNFFNQLAQLKDKTMGAIQYTEETMEQYREDVI